MANTKSVQKRARQSEKRTQNNRAVKTRVKSARRAVADSIAAGDKAAATEKWSALASAADRAAKSGVIHKNSAGRLKGLYAKRISALS